MKTKEDIQKMKKYITRIFSMLFVFILIFACTCSLFAAYDSVEKVTVTGTGTVLIPADRITLGFCIETHASSADTAKEKNDAALAAIKEAFPDIAEESYYSENDPRSRKYTVSRCLLLTSSNVGSAEEIIEKLTENGATSVNCICYSASDMSSYEKEALRLAIEDANSKAEALGLSLKLSEFSDYGCMRACDMSCIDTAGNIRIECNISAVYTRK